MDKYVPPRGMRDFFPEDYRVREAVFEAWRNAARRHGFEFYDAPVVETLELLERKAGEEISGQIYTFEDKSGRRLALRPELTPSLARMIISRQNALSLPLKWSAIVQCFRYERMTRGRKREHYQWNLDIVGEESVLAEAEVIAAAIDSLRRLGLTSRDYRVRIGSRALLGELLAESGLATSHFPACFLALDKLGKIGDVEIRALLKAEGLASTEVDRVFDLLGIRTLDQAAERAGAKSKALDDLRALFRAATPIGISDYLEFDLSIIRGLGYYTGIVFEAFDVDRRLRAIFGGGRYDNLLSSLGGARLPCVGLGFGDVVVAELLADRGRTPASKAEVDYAIGFMDEASRDTALLVARLLRETGAGCDQGLAPEKAKSFFKRANRIGARHAVFVGPDEVDRGTFQVKDMTTGESHPKTLEELRTSGANIEQT